MYYLCSENKGADQLRGYREADLRLCFRICEKPVFSRRGSIRIKSNVMRKYNTKQILQKLTCCKNLKHLVDKISSKCYVFIYFL